MNEEWREIPGSDGFYEVSSLGRARSWRKKSGRRANIRAEQPKILSSACDADGYHRFVFLASGIRKTVKVHRMILLAFIGPPLDADEQGCHLDGNVDNNRLENLAWGTAKTNAQHRRLHGTNAEGARAGLSKLTDNIVRELRQETLGRGSIAHLARRYGVNWTTVKNVLGRKTWGNVG